MADDKDNSQEKTEEATPKRQQDARDKGQVGRSKEFNTMSILMGSVLIMMIFGQQMINDLLLVMRKGFVIEREVLFNNEALINALYQASSDLLTSIAPVLVGLTVCAITAPLLIGGWVFSLESMTFKLDKLNPLTGLQRIFGPNGLMELFKALVKFSIVCCLIMLVLYIQADEILYIGNTDLKPALSNAGDKLLWAFLILSASTLIVAMIDVPFQIWEHNKKLKMTKQEVKDEMKETDGRPEVKSQMRSMQQELANQRMMEEVPKADVIITNPTHFAVALVYDQENMNAPKVIGKGADLVALRIRSLADNHNITIFEAPLLARALYHTTKINEQVPEGLYVAVAQVLAYVYQLKASKKDRNIQTPTPPDNLPVPEEYRFG